MSIELLNEFREKYQRFLKWLPYMREKKNKMISKPEKWKKIFNNFIEKIQDPMDKAWDKLMDAEKGLFL